MDKIVSIDSDLEDESDTDLIPLNDPKEINNNPNTSSDFKLENGAISENKEEILMEYECTAPDDFPILCRTLDTKSFFAYKHKKGFLTNNEVLNYFFPLKCVQCQIDFLADADKNRPNAAVSNMETHFFNYHQRLIVFRCCGINFSPLRIAPHLKDHIYPHLSKNFLQARRNSADVVSGALQQIEQQMNQPQQIRPPPQLMEIQQRTPNLHQKVLQQNFNAQQGISNNRKILPAPLVISQHTPQVQQQQQIYQQNPTQRFRPEGQQQQQQTQVPVYQQLSPTLQRFQPLNQNYQNQVPQITLQNNQITLPMVQLPNNQVPSTIQQLQPLQNTNRQLPPFSPQNSTQIQPKPTPTPHPMATPNPQTYLTAYTQATVNQPQPCVSFHQPAQISPPQPYTVALPQNSNPPQIPPDTCMNQPIEAENIPNNEEIIPTSFLETILQDFPSNDTDVNQQQKPPEEYYSCPYCSFKVQKDINLKGYNKFYLHRTKNHPEEHKRDMAAKRGTRFPVNQRQYLDGLTQNEKEQSPNEYYYTTDDNVSYCISFLNET